MFRKIVIGADGYAGGPDALCLAHTLAADHAELVLVDVYPDTRSVGDAAAEAFDALLRDDARNVLENRNDVHVDVRVRSVACASGLDALQDVAERECADLIVIGS